MIAQNSSVHNSTLHIFNVERYVGWGCILNYFMLSSLTLSMFLLICYPYIWFNVSILVHVTYFSSRRMLGLKFAIHDRAASLSSQASYAVLAEESSTRPGVFQTLPAHQLYF